MKSNKSIWKTINPFEKQQIHWKNLNPIEKQQIHLKKYKSMQTKMLRKNGLIACLH